MSTDPSTERYEVIIPVEDGDIDSLGHVNNTVYLRWVQDAAVAHWNSAATPEELASLVWVVVRHEIDYKHAAMPGDRIVARTWVGPATRLSFDRYTEILRQRDRRLLARARTVWVPLDPGMRRPCEVPDAVRARWAVPKDAAGEEAR